MPNDAKIGLVLGVALVMTVAAVFFRRDQGPATGLSTPTVSTGQRIGATSPTPGTTASRVRRHTVQPGDTLASLAQRYYGDSARAERIYQSNRDVMHRPDALEPGTVLTIPNVLTTTDPAASVAP